MIVTELFPFFFQQGSIFSLNNTLTSNEKPPVELNNINSNTEVWWVEDVGVRQIKTKLTGGAENLKSEEPLKARNFGEYIRS